MTFGLFCSIIERILYNNGTHRGGQAIASPRVCGAERKVRTRFFVGTFGSDGKKRVAGNTRRLVSNTKKRCEQRRLIGKPLETVRVETFEAEPLSDQGR